MNLLRSFAIGGGVGLAGGLAGIALPFTFAAGGLLAVGAGLALDKKSGPKPS